MDDSPGDSPTGTRTGRAPRWVKVFGVIAIILIALIVGTALLGGGHGPGQHSPGEAPSSRVTTDKLPPEGGHQPPRGGHG